MKRRSNRERRKPNKKSSVNQSCKKAFGPGRALTVWHKDVGYVFTTDSIAAIRVDIQHTGKDATQKTIDISVRLDLVNGNLYSFEDTFKLNYLPKKKDIGIQRLLFVDMLLDLLYDQTVVYVNFDVLFETLAKELGKGAGRVRW